MSVAEQQPVACPACAKQTVARIQRSVDAAADPELAEQLLDGRLFLFTCSACGHRARVVHPELRYRDTTTGLAVQLDALGTFDATRAGGADDPPPTTRVVRDSNSLMEKVKIARAGLDDRLVEAVKLLARASLPDAEGKRLLFEAAEGDGSAARLRFTLLGKDGSAAGMALPRAAYEKLERDLRAAGRLVDPGPWAVVDEMTARAMLGS